MDADRFDDFSRSLATRRTALSRLGAGGLVALLMGTRGRSAVAQDDVEATCEAELVASVRLGPSAEDNLGADRDGELQGVLRFALSKGGRVLDGRMELPDGTGIGVTGQADGQAVTFRIAVPLGGTLVLVGAGANAIRDCDGPWDGLMTGPKAGDLGDWHAAARAIVQPDAAEPTTTAQSNSSPDQSNGSTGGDSAPPSACLKDLEGPCSDDGECCERHFCHSDRCYACIPIGSRGCDIGIFCCDGGICAGGLCFTPDCGNANEPCGIVACCDGLYCNGTDCIPCIPSGSSCAFGLCCDGLFCRAEDSTCASCVLQGGDCSSYGCCVGYCGQDNQCECVSSGLQSAQVGTGGCCDGRPSGADGLCP